MARNGRSVIPDTEASKMEDDVLQLIALPEVVRISGISKSEIFRRIHARTFPQPVRIGTGRCTRWEMGEIQSWVKQRLAQREGQVA